MSGDHTTFHPRRAALALTLTLVCSVASYHLVEVPIRHSSWLRGWPTFVGAAIIAVLVMGATVPLGGTPLSKAYVSAVSSSKGSAAPEGEKVTSVVVVGDSVPKNLVGGFDEYLRPQGINVYDAARGGCSPLAVAQRTGATDDDGAQCVSVEGVQTDALAAYRPQLVVWWSRYELIDRQVDGQMVGPDSEAFWTAQRADLDRAVTRLTSTGARIVFVATDRPGTAALKNCTEKYCPPFIHRLLYNDEYRIRWNAALKAVADTNPRVSMIDVDGFYCKDAASPCDDSTGATPSRPDGFHFAAGEVSTMVGRLVMQEALATKG